MTSEIFLAPGLASTEAVAMTENLMEHIAQVTGKDSMAVRLANMTDAHKEALLPMIEELSKNADFEMRKRAVDTFNNVRSSLHLIASDESS